MGLFKKKKSTTVVNQQLGDKQFKTLDGTTQAIKKETSGISSGVNTLKKDTGQIKKDTGIVKSAE